MSFTSPRDEIARLEDQMELHAAAAERSRKLIVIARGAAGLGGLVLLGVIAGLLAWNTALTLFAIAALLGGMVLSGSSRSSLEQSLAALDKARRARDALIDGIAPVSVTLH
ncbi:hypothetical protein [Alsobacter soli]|uniref:hypothetical protein n=1 Tax=Alsobacter soli TaxID=2109933 RepID=UPI0011B25162|nr:hypothetical protein [Alsobacter soli]